MGAWRFFLSCVGCAGACCRGGFLAAYLVNRPYPERSEACRQAGISLKYCRHSDPGSAGGGIS